MRLMRCRRSSVSWSTASFSATIFCMVGTGAASRPTTGARLGTTRMEQIQTKSETISAVEERWVRVEMSRPRVKKTEM